MKRLLPLLLFLVLTHYGSSQSTYFGAFEPLKNSSPIFGKDIIINDIPIQDQQLVSVCSSYSGQLFASTYYLNIPEPRNTLFESLNSGIVWNTLWDYDIHLYGCILTKQSVITTGDNPENLRFFYGKTVFDTNNNITYLWLGRYKMNPISGNGMVMDMCKSRDFSMASDFYDPAYGANPTSYGLVSSRVGYEKDSLIFESSSDGSYITSRKVVSLTNRYFGKVGVSYGKSPNFNTGRYFAVWEYKQNEDSPYGNIYFSHSEPNFNSPFISPVCLDSLNPATIGKCRNPVIASQVVNHDNGSSGLTTIILFEKYNEETNRHDIQGYINRNSAQSATFEPFSFTNPAHNNIQPAITYNPFDSTFIITYFDSTAGKLPYLINSLKLTNPNTWTVVKDNYNDGFDLESPKPCLTVSASEQSGAIAWVAKRPQGNGVGLFDACYSTYTSTRQIDSQQKVIVNAYPNPCSTNITLEIRSKGINKVRLHIYNLPGQKVKSVEEISMKEGIHKINVDVSDLPKGFYTYLLETDSGTATGKINIMK